MSDLTPTRSAVLELQDERRAMREGYEFLDEKRLLLAAQILKELRAYETAWQTLVAQITTAAAALRAAVERHGLHGVQVYPPARLENAALKVSQKRLLGVRLQQAVFTAEPAAAEAALSPSPEAERCRFLFLELLRETAEIAAIAGNLERLRHEYRRTERRARALEDVLLPEIDQTLYEIESRLEEIEQEEAVRVRQA